MTTAEHFDVAVIGGGPGGYAAALYGAAAGLRIALVEKNKVGGTCLHVGCVPAKELLETAHVYRTVSSAGDYGIEVGEPLVDLATSQIRKQSIIDTLFKGLAGLLKGRKVTVLDGVGSLGPDHTVTVTGGESDGTVVTADAVIIATGSVPRQLPGIEVDGTQIVNSDAFLSIETLPARAAVIGGGAIGCEFATFLADLGSKVTILEALPKILPGCDDDVTRLVGRSFKKRGLEVRTGVRVTGTETTGSDVVLSFEDGDPLEVDLVVVSVGRVPLTDGLRLDETGVSVDDRGFVEVDDHCRTSVSGVYAIGDVVATPQLAHIGFAEGMLAIGDILGEEPTPIDYSRVPWCIYCHPEVAFAGHSEASAIEAGLEVVSEKHRFMGNSRALIIGEPDGLVKVIAEKRSDGTAGQVLGVHMVGPWVTEQLGQGYLAVNWEATVDDIAGLIQPHPTLSELFGETVLSLTGRGLHG